MKNWKTTLVGCLIAVLVAIQPLIVSGTEKWTTVVLAGAIALFGFIAKDFDKTGV